MANELCESIKAMGALLTQQRDLLGDKAAEVFRGQALALAAQVKTTPLTTSDAAAITTCVQASPFSEADRRLLVLAVQARISTSAVVGKRAQLQHIANLAKFLRETDVSYLRSTEFSFGAKARRMADLVYAIEAHHPSEPTSGHAVTLVSSLHGSAGEEQRLWVAEMTPITQKGMVQLFKMELKSMVKRGDGRVCDPVEHYPDSPELLPAVLREKVYSTSPPTSEDIGDCKNAMVLRSSDRRLRSGSSHHLALPDHVSMASAHSGQHAATHGMQTMQGLQGMFMMMQQLQQFMGNGASSSHIPIELRPPPRRPMPSPSPSSSPDREPTQLALMPPPPSDLQPLQPHAPPHEQELPVQSSALSAEEHANAMAVAMQQRTTNAKNALDMNTPTNSADGMSKSKKKKKKNQNTSTKKKSTKEAETKPAKKNDVFKRPSAAGSAAAGLSMAQRLAQRPNGCSKCRWKPACTPSCYK